jgi:hypothetical protein
MPIFTEARDLRAFLFEDVFEFRKSQLQWK